jgi:hypothetical protein
MQMEPSLGALVRAIVFLCEKSAKWSYKRVYGRTSPAEHLRGHVGDGGNEKVVELTKCLTFFSQVTVIVGAGRTSVPDLANQYEAV